MTPADAVQRTPAPADELLAVVRDSLDLLRQGRPQVAPEARPDIGPDIGPDAETVPPLADLLAQCHEIAARVRAAPAEPVRTVHHFACTGGTLICRFLAATPNARLLSEIDPLSPIPSLRFSPLDLILLYRNTARPVRDEVVSAAFLAGLKVIHDHARLHGERLILRDHTHSHFCTGPEIPVRQTLYQSLATTFPLRALVTVRHPLDSYLSLLNNGWEHFLPHTMDEYARRYHAFLDAYADHPIFTYEDFIASPETTLKAMCAHLQLAYVPNLSDLAPAIPLTGDSGRRSNTLGKRKRREIPGRVDMERETSQRYIALCDRLGYQP